MRDLFQSEAGGGLPVPSGLHVAAGGGAPRGSYNHIPVPNRPLCRSSGRSVLPGCKPAGATGRNRPRSGIRGRNKGGKQSRTIYVLRERQCRKLPLRRESTELEHGQFVTSAWYRCEDCRNCPQRNACCQAKDPEKPKEIMLRKTFWELRSKSQETWMYPKFCVNIAER